MKKYTRPNLEITSFDVRDIITISGELLKAEDLTGDVREMYDTYKMNSEAKNTNVSVFTW